jgi:putative NADPH-quinone reductase
VQHGLKESGQQSGLIHLDKDGFDPVMRSKDLKAFAMAGKGLPDALDDVDPLVRKYKTKLEQAEHLVLIFPIWWMNMPAMMKGFIDKVIFPAIAYDMKGGLLKSRLPIKKVTVISTMNTPAEIYREHFNNALEGNLIKGTFRQIGIDEVEWISLSMVKQASQEERELWLENLRIRFGSAV